MEQERKAVGKIRIKLVRSPNGRIVNHIRTVRSLGLKKVNSSVVQEDTPQIRGMIRKVGYLLSVEEVSE
ncbi:50S ribosomal protein L30 [Candidatus Sumerlaeota bacterium]|nr:50S ribosomal protein L30 [Candidatus Sumerlaeota bacterium]